MTITIDPKTNRATVAFSAEIELGRSLEVERVQVWHVVSGPDTVAACTSEASANDVKARLDAAAKAMGKDVPTAVVRKADLDVARRYVADEEVLRHVRREAAVAFQAALAAAEIPLPPVS